ncbi:MAG TPA: LysR family transcriptional regulator [Candidatus Saccharimonadales bacterium]|nr:LysR family transcriptional regulator [Candidatus Saccharimonadales bacterium]
MEDRLHKFARLVDAGSFTKAAELMHISQPALTAAIQKLERELRAELLIRGKREFRLTTAGSMAYETAKQLQIEAQNLRQRLADAEGQKTTLRLGMIDSVADMMFVHNDKLRKLEKSTQLSLAIDNSDRLIKSIEHDDLDVAFIASPSSLPQSLMSINLGQEPLVLVTHASHTEQVQKEIQQGCLRNFLGYNQNSHTYRLVNQHLAGQGISTQHRFYSTSPSIMLELILSKRGTAALPYLLVKPHIHGGKLALVQMPNGPVIARHIVSLHRAGRQLPGEVNALLADAQQQLTKLMQQAKNLALVDQ